MKLLAKTFVAADEVADLVAPELFTGRAHPPRNDVVDPAHLLRAIPP